ncbi:MAG: hypothetical protein M3M85_03195 [bacterium]|nr:hypothetical protein [bacterium]
MRILKDLEEAEILAEFIGLEHLIALTHKPYLLARLLVGQHQEAIGWRSVVTNSSGLCMVPCTSADHPRISWRLLFNLFDFNDKGFRFR